MVPYADFLFYSQLASVLHALIFWQVYVDGTYQPLLLPVDETTWRQIVQ